MAWVPDKKAMAGLFDLYMSMLVHGQRGCAWQEVCAVLGCSVEESFAWGRSNPPRTRKMVRIAQRYKALRRAAMAEALRRMRGK